jgi:hypothetical protein
MYYIYIGIFVSKTFSEFLCLKGYWVDKRALDNMTSSYYDFDKFSVFTCDYEDSCLGTCYSLYSSKSSDDSVVCSVGYENLSPTCGVCEKRYYISNSR